MAGRKDLSSAIPAVERFWAQVKKSEGCWLWTGTTTGAGYGEIGIDGGKMLAHRFAYELLTGPIPEGMTIESRGRKRLLSSQLRQPRASRGRNAAREHPAWGRSIG